MHTDLSLDDQSSVRKIITRTNTIYAPETMVREAQMYKKRGPMLK